MEPVPLCTNEVILTLDRPEQLMGQDWKTSRAEAVVVPDAISIETARALVGERPVGALIRADGWNPEEDIGAKWPSERLIGRMKNLARRAVHESSDFIYIRMRQNLHVLRAAILAVTELSGLSILVELPVDEDGRTLDGSSVMAIMGIVQRMGVAGLILTGEPEDVDDAIEELAPHAKISLGISVEPKELDEMQHLGSVEFYQTRDPEDVDSLLEHIREESNAGEPEADDDYILAPVGEHAHFVDVTIDISDPIDLEDHFEEHILELEDEWCGAVKLEIACTEDVHLLAESQHMISFPVCLGAENPVLFEQALRTFDGIALYDGTNELEQEELDYFRQHYGLVVL